MSAPIPERSVLWRAIEVYLSHAYPAAPPASVQARVEQLRATAAGESILQSPIFERSPAGEPRKFTLRLGNRFYPHMKLSVDCRPDKMGYLFRVDTHDRHLTLPAGSPERAQFQRLMEENQKLATKIESAWDDAGVPTFKSYLKQDLERRRHHAADAAK
jgi:hypothetical protein